jgi:hypothetical protein
MQDFVITRLSRFHPTTDFIGKWHAIDVITDTTPCRATTALIDRAATPIVPRIGTKASEVHPLVCRRCLSITAR